MSGTIDVREEKLQRGARWLLDVATVGRTVPAEVTEEFLAKLKVVLGDLMPVSGTWEALGLGGAHYQLNFRTNGSARLAVRHLMRCHQHHFAVVGEGRSVVMSELAVNCLRAQFGGVETPEPVLHEVRE